MDEKKESTFEHFVEDWKIEFTDKIEQALKSRKEVFTLNDAINKSTTKNRRSKFDSVMIEYLNYVESNPLNENDYFKYLNSYKDGKKLDEKYFKHDLSLLHELYAKIDDNPKYSPFSVNAWRRYVLFMLLKFNDEYKPEAMDKIFNVGIIESREYNPLVTLTRPLRGMLPSSIDLVEYDISRAYPTFIDMELGIDRKEDVYSLIDKCKFSKLINLHKENKGAKISNVRHQLKPVYGDQVNDVITEERFNNQARMFEDLSKYEKKYIERFIEVNNIKTYVRLHDAIFVLTKTQIKQLEFDKVKFKKKSEVRPPEIVNDNKLFYSFNDKGKVITSPVVYKDFFEQENFIRVSIKDDDNITIFKDTNNVVNPFNHRTNTVSFLKSKINELDTCEVENKIAKDNNKDIRESFCLLDAVPLLYYRDEINSFGIPFKNGFVNYTKGKEQIEVKSYTEVNGFFPEHKTQQREVDFIEDPKLSEFERFLTMVAIGKDPLKDKLTKEDESIQFLFFRMFGYLAHTHKSQSFSPSIILSDMGADDNSRNGGRGKTIIAKALSEVQKTMIKGGNEFDGGYRHRFADLDEAYKIYVIDDVPASFNFNDLYTNIVGGISVEPKGKASRTIEFKETPKFLITTNWAVRYDEKATSTNRRFIEFKLTDYFNINNTPKDVFEHTLFDNWNPEQWNAFYNFVFMCVASYLELGLEAPEYNKDDDNFRAYFYNDTLLSEFERVLSEITKDNTKGFNVSEFLRIYESSGNVLRYEKFFTSKNTKTLINTYLKHHKINFNYREDLKKWFVL
jgi:hypothetical protein